MFEKFGDILYEAGYYEVEVEEIGKVYFATNIQAEKRELWSRVRFKVTVGDNREEFECECGQFEHMGMLCCHILKVVGGFSLMALHCCIVVGSTIFCMESDQFFCMQIMDHLDVKKIPARHIVKRWTRDARDVLPDHLAHYQRDQLAKGTFTFRHSQLYLQALQLVRMGDTSVEAYEKLTSLFSDNIVTMQPYTEKPDGLGLEEQQKEKEKRAATVTVQKDKWITRSENDIDALKAPGKKRPAGRPSNSRDRAPYEGTSKRTRFCTICRRPGHRSTTCPDRGDLPKKPRKVGRCTICGVEGHRKDTCLKRRKLDEC
jgi:hypothetical protein